MVIDSREEAREVQEFIPPVPSLQSQSEPVVSLCQKAKQLISHLESLYLQVPGPLPPITSLGF